jgi:hypothetical protein
MKKRHLLLAAAVVVVSTFNIVACKKQSPVNNATTQSVTKEKIETLAERFTQPIGNNYAKALEDYNSLNETDLKTFWHEIYLGNKKAGYSNLSEQEFSALFDKINNDSKTAFGEPFNKLPQNSLNVAMSSRDNIAARAPIDPPPGSCGYYAYPVNLYENNNLPPSPPFFTYTIVDYWPGDCDGVEVVYSGIWNASKSTTLLGYQTGPVYPIGKYVNGNTKVLFKKSVMLMAFGSIENINNHKRMANGIIESRN